ncbi:MAG: aldo/keto reductase [Candidatus Eremiobacteraeota bacterium]|nr:aldo/keto reductase [Candidatus Eremiobacteraeota bacterium]
MPVVQFGRTGMRVSRVCLGTMTFGGQADEKTSAAIMDVAEEHGIFFFDLADMYPIPNDATTVGKTEEFVGRWMRGKRDRFVLASKFHAPMGAGPNDRGNSRVHMMRAVDASLRRLQTDYLDLYQIHRWDDTTPIEETLQGLDDLRRAGKIRYAGASNLAAWQLMSSLRASELKNIVRFESVQPRYNVLFRSIEAEMVPACVANGLAIMAYNPLAAGMLTGKYRAGQPPIAGTRFTFGGNSGPLYGKRYWHEETLALVERLKADVASRGKSLTHVALRWVLDQPGITVAIVGASKPEQLQDSLKGVHVTLDDADRAACDGAWYALPRRTLADES